jgi:hypothetical protein
VFVIVHNWVPVFEYLIAELEDGDEAVVAGIVYVYWDIEAEEAQAALARYALPHLSLALSVPLD